MQKLDNKKEKKLKVDYLWYVKSGAQILGDLFPPELSCEHMRGHMQCSLNSFRGMRHQWENHQKLE